MSIYIFIYAAELLGFEKAISPFATAEGAEILKGVNYASGGGGILDDSGRLQVGLYYVREFYLFIYLNIMIFSLFKISLVEL